MEENAGHGRQLGDGGELHCQSAVKENNSFILPKLKKTTNYNELN